jgi:hypothetical protein
VKCISAHGARVHGAHFGVFGKAVGGDRLGHMRHDGAHVRIVDAQHGAAVERQAVRELHEGLLELSKSCS